MDTQKALNTLIQAIQVATKRGAFELVETEVILQAVKFFTEKKDDTEQKPAKDTKNTDK